MGCFPCFKIKKERSNKEVPDAQPRDTISPSPQPQPSPQSHPSPVANKNTPKVDDHAHNGITEDGNSSAAKAFTFRELATATKHFRKECMLSESGIGRVFKGTLQSNGQVVVVRQLDRSATQGSKEFAEEVLMLSQLHHRNLVKMIGYCADGDQRMLVHEYVPNGTLENHIFDLSKDKKPLDWLSRMKIALGITEGLAYLHGEANPPIIYRSLKTSNVLLDNDYTPKLSEYGLATLLQSGNNLHAAPTVMSAYGYCAPECEMQGDATSKSDVYSFGVVLLELITGRRAYDDEKPTHEQILVVWAKPFFSDPKKFPEMADPLLKNRFPTTSINQAVGVASMCTQEEPSVRPLITDVVDALSFLAMAPPEAPIPNHLVPILSGKITPSPSQHHDTNDDNNNSH